MALGALLLAAAPLGAQDGAPIGPLERGHRAFRNRDYDGAVRWYREAAERGDGTRARALYWLGRAHHAADRPARAARALERAVAAGDPGVKARVYLGRARLADGDAPGAVRALARARERAPDSKAALFWYGRALRRAGRPGDAVDPLERLCGLDSEGAVPRRELGRAHLAAGDPGAAARAYAEACERDPEDARTWTWLGLSRVKAGDARGAREALRKALRRDDTQALAHYWMGRALLALDRPETAVRALRSAVERDPGAPLPRLWLARARVAAGAAEDAIEGLERVVDDADHAGIQALYGRLLAAADRTEDAAAALRRAAQLDPRDTRVLRDLARAHLDLGQPRPARRALETAVEVDPADRDAWRLLGRLHRDAGRRRAARDAFRRLVEAAGAGSAPAADRALLGRAELALGRAAAARPHLDAAVEASERPGAALLADAGVARLGAGDPAAALEPLARAASARPRDARVRDYRGRALHALDRREEAARAFRAATRRDGGRPRPWRRLAEYALAGGAAEEARDLAARAVAAAPEDVACLELAGRASLAAGAPAAAAEHLGAAARAAPRRADLALRAGEAAVRADRPRAALEHLERARALLAPERAEAGGDGGERGAERGGGDAERRRARADVHLWLGRALLALDRAGPAAQRLETCARLRPGAVEAWRALARARREAGDLPGVVAALEGAVRAAPEDAPLRGALVDALLAEGRAAPADEARPAWVRAAFPELRAHLDGGRHRRVAEEAARLAGASEEDLPGALEGELHLLRARALEALGDVSGATVAVERAEEDASWSYRVALFAGDLEGAQGDAPAARARYREAAARAPDRAAPAVRAALALLRSGDVRGALTELRAATRRHSDAPEPVLERVRLLSLREEVERAVAALEAGGSALDAAARETLHSDPDYRALWGRPRFRAVAGPPPDAGFRFRRAPGEAELLGAAGSSAYTASGELRE